MGAAFWGLVLAVSILSTGCASVRRHPDTAGGTADHSHWQPLEDSLVALSPTVDRGEAARLAARAYESSRELALDYRAVRPAVCQNVLVNLGLRTRGLCYHWAEDMRLRLQELELETLEIDWAVARPATWREHNCLVVGACGQPFDQRLVLDAWRHAGRLFWGPVATDRYPWQPESADPQPSPGR